MKESRIEEQKNHFDKEIKWVKNFHLMCSKDNDFFPKGLRELFDSPIEYDVNGTRYKTRPEQRQSMKMLDIVPNFLKTDNLWLKNGQMYSTQNAKTINSFYKSNSSTILTKYISKYPLISIQKNEPNERKLQEHGIVKTNNEIIEDHFIQIPILRKNEPGNKLKELKEKFWNGRVERISHLNETYHSHYRKWFEDIVKKSKNI